MPLDKYTSMDMLTVALLAKQQPNRRVVMARLDYNDGTYETGYARHLRCTDATQWRGWCRSKGVLLIDDWDSDEFDLGTSIMRRCADCEEEKI
jgi:hypothetical protein